MQHPAIPVEAHRLKCSQGSVQHAFETKTKRDRVGVYIERGSHTWIAWTSRCLTSATVQGFYWLVMIGEEEIWLARNSSCMGLNVIKPRGFDVILL